MSSYDLRQTFFIGVFFLLGDSPASEFCADVWEHSVPSSFEPNLYAHTHTHTHIYIYTQVQNLDAGDKKNNWDEIVRIYIYIYIYMS